MVKTTFRISKMDCPAEEQLVRAKLEGMANIRNLRFIISERKLEICHTDSHESLLAALESLRLGTRLISSETVEAIQEEEDHHRQRRVLWQVLAINLFFFVLEIILGFIAGSMGLVADSLDMLADSIVYGLSLFAVGGTVIRKKNIAGAAGYFQATLAVLGFAEVAHRFLGHAATPDFHAMIFVSFLALAGNAACLYLLQESESRDAHMQASMIFTSMDVVVNIGVIVAGGFVYLTGSKIPDLVVGTIVFVLVGRGAYTIMRLSK